jgi:hypothetical protein
VAHAQPHGAGVGKPGAVWQRDGGPIGQWYWRVAWPRPQPRVLLGFEILCAWCAPLWHACRRWAGARASPAQGAPRAVRSQTREVPGQR